MPDWKNPQYLQTGNPRQQRAHAVLAKLSIWAMLHDYDPVLAGTIPLAIDVPGSDLDIICEVPITTRAIFNELLQKHYGHLCGFQLTQKTIGGHASVVCNFRYDDEAVEVFGQAVPTLSQYAYRHLVIEYAVLQAGGESWRAAVQQLKQRGLKTEPAFAQLLQLAGDPYEALLALEGESGVALQARLAGLPLPSPSLHQAP